MDLEKKSPNSVLISPPDNIHGIMPNNSEPKLSDNTPRIEDASSTRSPGTPLHRRMATRSPREWIRWVTLPGFWSLVSSSSKVGFLGSIVLNRSSATNCGSDCPLREYSVRRPQVPPPTFGIHKLVCAIPNALASFSKNLWKRWESLDRISA